MLTTCDCGNRKHPDSEACERCSWLDGDGPGEWAIIEALRACDGGATKQELERDTGLSYRQVLRIVKRLVGSGRLIFLVDGKPARVGTNFGPGHLYTYVLAGGSRLAA